MSLSELMHGHTQYTNSKNYIWHSNSEIDQFSINLVYLPGSLIVWLSSTYKFTLAFIGVLAGLQPKSLVSSWRSRTYFRCERSTLCFWCATLISRKYLGLLMSLVTKWRLRYSFFSNIPAESLLVAKYHQYILLELWCQTVCQTKTEWSEWHR